MKKTDHTGLSGKKVFRTIVCLFLCFLALFPFYILIINSTLRHADIASGIKLIPGKYFFQNFQSLFDPEKRIVSTFNLFQAFRNSIIITVPTTILQIYFGSLTAYALTVYRFKGRDFAWGFNPSCHCRTYYCILYEAVYGKRIVT